MVIRGISLLSETILGMELYLTLSFGRVEHLGKLTKKVTRVVWARRSLRMILNRKRTAACHLNSLTRPII